MVILLFFKKRKYYYNREFLSISVWYIFKKKIFCGLIEEIKYLIKFVFSYYFNSFCVVFFLSSDSFLYIYGYYGNNGFLRVCVYIVLCLMIK